MKKRIGSIIIAAFLLAALIGCGTPATPADTGAVSNAQQEPATEPMGIVEASTLRAFDIYSDIMQRLSLEPGQSGGYDIDMVIGIEMDLDGESMNVVTSGNVRMIVDGYDVQTIMISETYIDGFTMEMELRMTIEDGEYQEISVYVDGVEIPAELFGLAELEGMMDNMIAMPEFGEEAIISADIAEIGNTLLITLVIDGEEISDFAMAAVNDQIDAFGVIDFDMSIGDVVMTITADSDDNPLSMTMDMQMSVTVEDETIGMNMTSEFVFNSFELA